MTDCTEMGTTRREFIDRFGLLSVAAIVPHQLLFAETEGPPPHTPPEGEFDLSWIAQLSLTTDKAVVDSTQPNSCVPQVGTRTQ